MGMSANQLALVRYVAENNIRKAKEAALCCCAEDTTQKNHYAVARYQQLLRSGGMNLFELPANISSFATMEDLTNTYLENRYYLTDDERQLFELIKNMNDVSLQLMEKQIPYLNATLLYGESGVGKTAFPDMLRISWVCHTCESGKYYFYNENFEKKGDFSADDMDICVDGKTVAFKRGDKWGFVNVNGEIVIEPQYTKARSFANGYAAVCNENNLWGFLNDKYELCIDYTYKNALYFNGNETCLVSTTENTVQLLHFMFE